MKINIIKESLDRGFKRNKKRSAVFSAFVLLLCAAFLFVGLPMLVTTTSAADGCTHECDSSCGFTVAVPCDHSHNAACGYAAASPCTYVHIHNDDCGFDGEVESSCLEGSHIHNNSCGYTAAAVCEHVCFDGTCSFVAASPCGHTCNIACGGVDADGDDDGLIDDNDEDGDTSEDAKDSNSVNNATGETNNTSQTQGFDLLGLDDNENDDDELWYGDVLPFGIMGMFEGIEGFMGFTPYSDPPFVFPDRSYSFAINTSINIDLEALTFGADGNVVYDDEGSLSSLLGVTLVLNGSTIEGTAPATASSVETFIIKATDDNGDGDSVTATFSIVITEDPNQPLLTIVPIGPLTFIEDNDEVLETSGGDGTGVVSFAVVGGPGYIADSTNILEINGAGIIYVQATKAAQVGSFNEAISPILEIEVAPFDLDGASDFKIPDSLLPFVYNGLPQQSGITQVEFTFSGDTYPLIVSDVVFNLPATTGAGTNADTISVSINTTDSVNYIGGGSFNFTIAPKLLTLDFTSFEISKVYDGDEVVKGGFGTPTINLSDFVLSETADVDTSDVEAEYDDKNAGEDKDITFTNDEFKLQSGGSANPGNYIIAMPDSGDVKGDIEKITLTINTVTHKKVYDGNILIDSNDMDIELSYTNKYSGDDENEIKVDTFDAAYTSPAVPTVEVSIEDIQLIGNDAHNYTVANVIRDLTGISDTGLTPDLTTAGIFRRNLVITGWSISKIYDSNTNIVGGFGDLSFTNGGNTDAGLVSGEEATVDITNVVGTYSDANVSTSPNYVTFSGDPFSVGAPLTGTPATSGNYFVLQPGATDITGTITRRDLHIVGWSISKIYDSNTNVVGGFGALSFTNGGNTDAGLVSGEEATVDITNVVGTYSDANVSTSPNYVTFSVNTFGVGAPPLGTPATPGNYNVLQPGATDVTGDITTRPLAIDTWDITKPFDDTTAVTEWGAEFKIGGNDGLQNGETAIVVPGSTVGTYGGNAPAPGTSYPITFTGTAAFGFGTGTATESNYNIIQPDNSSNLTGTIGKRELTINGATAEMRYNGTANVDEDLITSVTFANSESYFPSLANGGITATGTIDGSDFNAAPGANNRTIDVAVALSAAANENFTIANSPFPLDNQSIEKNTDVFDSLESATVNAKIGETTTINIMSIVPDLPTPPPTVSWGVSDPTFIVKSITGDLETKGVIDYSTSTTTNLNIALTLAAEENDKAVITIEVTSGNYANFDIAVEVIAQDKDDVSNLMTFIVPGSLTYTGLGQAVAHNATIISGTTSGGLPFTPDTDFPITYTYAVAPTFSGSLTGTSPNERPLDAGTYTVTATYDDNVNIGIITRIFSITPAPVTASINTSSVTTPREFDNNPNITGATIVLSGGVNSENPTATATTISFVNANVGTDKGVTATGVALTDDSSGANVNRNYTIINLTGTDLTDGSTLAITPRPISVTEGTYAVTKPYDGTNSAGSGNPLLLTVVDPGGVFAADGSVNITAEPSAFSHPNVGPQNIVVNLGISGNSIGNYTLQTASLDPFEASITAITFPDAIPPRTENLRNNDPFTLDILLESLLPPNPPSMTLGNITLYALVSYTPGTVSSNATIISDDLSIVIRDTATGLTHNETITVAITTQNFGVINVPINLSASDRQNLNDPDTEIVVTPSTLLTQSVTFGTAAVPITASNLSVTGGYTGGAFDFTVNYSGGGYGPFPVVPTNAGTYSVTITAGNANYVGTRTIANVLTINPADQATLTVDTPSPITFGDPAVTLTSSGGSGAGAVTFAIIPGGTGIGTIGGPNTDQLTITQAGTIFVRATKAASANYNVANSANLTITVSRAEQATLTMNAVPNQTFANNLTVDLSVTGTTGGSGSGAVTYNVISGPGSISGGNQLTITGAEPISVTATKAADTNYNAITSAPISITVAAQPIANAVITVTTPVRGDAPNTTATLAPNPNFTAGAVTWAPTVTGTPPFFAPLEDYTATVILTASANYTFTGGLGGTVTINGQTATVTNNTGSNVTLSYQFPQTDPVDVPGVPRSFQGVAADGQVTLSWIAPLNNGGDVITEYEVSSDNGATWITASSMTGHLFTGLTNGIEYTFLVRAVNGEGEGTEAEFKATPVAPPDTVAPGGSDGSVDVPYIPPSSDGTVTLVINQTVLDELKAAAAATQSVRINLKGVSGARAAKIDTAVLTDVAGSNLGAQIDLPQGTISLDPTATAALASQANGSDITLSLTQVSQISSLTMPQQVAFQPGDLVFTITATSGGVAITTFGGGYLSITVLYSGPVPVTVYHMAADGTLTSRPSTYDAATGTVTFRTPTLSEYVIRHTPRGSGSGTRSPQTGDYSNTTLWQAVLLGSVFGIMLTIILRNHLNKKHKWDRMIEEYKNRF